MASITRTDDVKKIKGVIVFPQTVDDVMFSFTEVDEYRVTLSSGSSMADEMTVEVMTKNHVADDFAETVRAASARTNRPPLFRDLRFGPSA